MVLGGWSKRSASFGNNQYKRVDTTGFLIGLPLFGDWKGLFGCWCLEEDKEDVNPISGQEDSAIKKWFCKKYGYQ